MYKELKYYHHVFAANDFFKYTVQVLSYFFFCFHDYWRCYRHVTGRINYLQKTKISLLKLWLHCIYVFLHCYCLYRNIYGIHVKENYISDSVYIINRQNTTCPIITTDNLIHDGLEVFFYVGNIVLSDIFHFIK